MGPCVYKQSLYALPLFPNGGETILSFGACEDDTTDVYRGGQTGGDNIVRENLFGTSVRTDHLELC